MATMNILVAVCLVYVAFLFAVAFGAERAARQGQGGWLRSPVVYTLSLSIYCTAWTFYGSVGMAARDGLGFLTVYLGPTLMTILGWLGLRAIDPTHPDALESVWLVTGAWILVRASFGMLRIWPGIGASPFRPSS